MKRYLVLALIITIFVSLFVGCDFETVPKETSLPTLSPLDGNILENTHQIEGFEFITTYDTGNYDLSRWRITDSKVINMTAIVRNIPDGAIVLIEHAHIDISLKSTNAQLDGLSQDSMDDSFHGTSQDGFFINSNYPYQNKFAIEGFSKDLIDGWSFVCGNYGGGSINEERLTEKNLVKEGNVYANKIQVVYDILIKYENEDFFHVVSVMDEFLIPLQLAE